MHEMGAVDQMDESHPANQGSESKSYAKIVYAVKNWETL